MATTASSAACEELEQIEQDDALHDFAGPHSNKGNDFAHYWVMLRAIELEKKHQPDYVLICEYVQDVAEFDSVVPTRLQLYQLKKKEGAYWTVNTLTGQTKTDKKKKPKSDSPVYKLITHVRKFKNLITRGAFVSNAKYDVSLKSGQSSVNETTLGLDTLDDVHADALKVEIAAAEGLNPEDIDLSLFQLLHTPLAIDDLQRHMNGVMQEYLVSLAPEHSAQAPSLVDTLFSRIKARARRTEKCASWPELMDKRGFSRASFVSAVESLQSIPDKAVMRMDLLKMLSSQWTFVQRALVTAALTKCAREKILLGAANRWGASKGAIATLCEAAHAGHAADLIAFEQVCDYLVVATPELLPNEIKALAIYEITEWILNQTHA
jgi:hypothetical protein